jgi:hypothetical protein
VKEDLHGHQPDELVRRSFSSLYLPLGLTVLATLALAYDIAWRNQPEARQAWWPEFLGEAGAVTLLTVGVTALIARTQFARSKRPSLSYTSRWVRPAERQRHDALRPDEWSWQVMITNSGQGPLYIDSVQWHIRTRSGEESNMPTMQKLRQELRRLELVEGAHYWIVNFSRGHSLPPGEERCYFECGTDLIDVAPELHATISYSSVVGDVLKKRVVLQPTRNAPAAAADDAAAV